MSLDSRRLVEWLPSPAANRVPPFALSLGAALAVYVAYLLTHPYPAYGAGLYLETATQIAANGYEPPARIPGYAATGVPFAYPPLAFYVLAVLIDVTGVDPLAVARFLPGLLVLAYLVPYYGVASELSASPRRAALAAVLLATAPPVLQWHISAGGVVRALAFLFALSSIYAGVRLFRTHTLSWLAVATVTFALVVLTHPTYTVFAVVSYLVLYVALDRSLRGLASGAVVGLGGLVLAAPWWLHVAGVHGIDVFFVAAGTHGGVGTGGGWLLGQLTAPLGGFGIAWAFYLVVYAGALYALWKHRWFLPAWMLAAVIAVPKTRFLFVPGSLVAAAFVFEGLAPAVRGRVSAQRVRRMAPTAVAGLVVLAAVTAGTLYGAGAVTGIRDSPAQPQFVDADDVEAMEWAGRNTPRDASFVALGDAAEWLPFLADRTILIGPWGAEWKEENGYSVEYQRQESISVCRDAACIYRSMERADVHPDYVYVPKGHYTVFNRAYDQSPSMSASLATSERFRVVFENDGVVVAEVVDGASQAGTDQPAGLDRREGHGRQDADE